MPNAKDLVLRLKSITDGFKTDQPVRELDDLEQAMTATGAQASKSSREVRTAADDMNAPGFDKAAAEAEATAARMKAAAEDMATGVRTGATDINTETGKIQSDMADTGREAGAEFVGNIAESIGSGSGSITDVVQGTLGGLTNLAASLAGPVGLAAGAAAAGIGMVFAKVKAEADAMDERVQDLMGALAELGEMTSKAAKETIWEDWLKDLKADTDQLNLITDLIGMAGVDQKTLKDAITGSATAQADVKAQMEATAAAIEDNWHKTGLLSDEEAKYLQHWRDVTGEIDDQQTALGETKTALDNINTLTGDTKTKTKSWKDTVKDVRGEVQGLNSDLNNATRNRSLTIYANVKTQGDKSVLPNLPKDPRKGSAARGGSGGYTGGYG